MVKLIFKTFGIALLFLITMGCVSAPELNLTQLEDRVFYVDQLLLMVSTEVDTNNTGKEFIISQYPEMLPLIRDMLLQENNIELRYDDFTDAIRMDQVIIEEEHLEDFGSFNKYKWTNSNKYDQNVWISIPFAPDAQGNMTALVRFEKKNPDNSEQYSDTTIFVSIKMADK